MSDTLDFCIKNFPATKAATKRFVGPYTDCKSAWDILSKWAKENSIINDDAMFFGIAYDDPKKVKDCRYDACISLSSDVSVVEGIKIQEISEHKCIFVTHKGTYSKLCDVYTKIYEGEPSKQHNINHSKPCIEVYKNCPERTPEDELITEIYVPIEE